MRREQELLVQAKQLELEDAGCRLEAELREYIALDSRDIIQQHENSIKQPKVIRFMT